MKRQWWIVYVGLFTLLSFQYFGARTKQLFCEDYIWNLGGDDFEGFDNETGVQSEYIVPNYVHFLRYGETTKEFNFVDAVVVLAAFKNQKPEKIFFHTDQVFTGHFWNVLVHTKGLMDVVEFLPTDVPDEIYGQKLHRTNGLWHAGDLVRMRLLMKYGGIFLDNDSYIIRSLDNFRRFEMALPWDDTIPLGTQVLIAHKDARFLRLWHYSYKDHYWGNLWYYNAGQRPTEVILGSRPELVHRVKLLFGVHDLRKELYQEYWKDYKKLYAVHLLTRHVKCIKQWPYDLPLEFTVDNVDSYPNTFKEIVYDVFNFTLHRSLLDKQ